MIIDRESDNKDAIAELAQRYKVKKVVMSAYHPQANEIIKYKYKPIIDVSSKMLDERFINWV